LDTPGGYIIERVTHNKFTIRRKPMITPRTVLASIATMLMLMFVTLLDAQQSQSAESSTGPRLIGSWIVIVTIYDRPDRPPCTDSQLDPQGRCPSISTVLATFTRDGRVITSTPTDSELPPFFFPYAESSGHGEWIKVGSHGRIHEYAFTFLRLVYNAQGTLKNIFKLRSQVTINEDDVDRATGEIFKVDVLDPEGKFLFTVEGNSQLTRIKVEPFE
jgi:hypothetical protein